MSLSSVRPKSFFSEPLAWLYSFWKFSRPHTIIGTSLSVFALYFVALAITNSTPNLSNLGQLLGAWIACLCGNIYIVGLNQIEDVAIDQINKPHLPLASGEFSPKQGQWIVIITGIFAFVISLILGRWLWTTVSLSLAIGTAYSLPPIRLKRFPFLAALCIFTVRGIIVNLGLFLHFAEVLVHQFLLPPAIWVLTLFVLVFTVAIAIFKDVPDLEGDREYNITTFTLLVGKATIFKLSLGVITVCYLAMIFCGILQFSGMNSWGLILIHGVLLILLWWRSHKVDLEQKESITNFYQFIWKLFFLEYLLFPLTCFII